MAKMNANVYVIEDYENETYLPAQKTNPTCRGVASGEAGFKPNFHILRLASTAFYVKIIIETNPKGQRGEGR